MAPYLGAITVNAGSEYLSLPSVWAAAPSLLAPPPAALTAPLIPASRQKPEVGGNYITGPEAPR